MAIGTGAAIALGASALASGASAAIGSSASKKASNAAERSAAESTALQREIYSQNANALAPYVNAGVPATQQINALLGLGSVSTAPTGSAAPSGPDWNLYLQNNQDVMRDYYANVPKSQFATAQDYAQWHYGRYGANEGRAFPTAPQATQSVTQPAGTTQAAAEQAFQTFRDNTGYKFNLDEGLNAVRGGFSGSGTLQSGAALKALQQRGSSVADGTFYNYLAALGNQQGVGLSAASAQAGVGQNYANSMAQINANRADAQGNAALVGAGFVGNALDGLASTASYLTGGFGPQANRRYA